jgi:hypothetical protein
MGLTTGGPPPVNRPDFQKPFGRKAEKLWMTTSSTAPVVASGMDVKELRRASRTLR